MNIDVISIVIRYRESRGGSSNRRGVGSRGRIHGGERKKCENSNRL